MSPRGASAPGKAFLCGEYAVLSGAPAIIAAVNKRVVARWTGRRPGEAALPLEARATLDVARERFGQAPQHLSIDTRRLFNGAKKLGLGSSAAVAVASAAAVAALRGHDVAERDVRDTVFSIASRGHSAVAPEGSGADVAAATYGGYVCFQKQHDGPLVQQIEPPSALTCLLIWTGEPARTSDLLARVSRLAALEPKLHDRCMSALHRHASEFAEAFQSGDGRGIVRHAREYGACMSALGEAADAPIMNDKLGRIAQWATWHGGAAKPCGAGGGDLAVAFFLDRGASDDFAAACETDGLAQVQAQWGAEGVRALQEIEEPAQATYSRSTS